MQPVMRLAILIVGLRMPSASRAGCASRTFLKLGFLVFYSGYRLAILNQTAQRYASPCILSTGKKYYSWSIFVPAL
jgi:hypothetical protein